MDPMVLLRHDTPGGGHHYDWMLSRPSGGETRLLSFRCESRVDLDQAGEIAVERIGDHRRDFLGFEGGLSGGRGCVVRVAVGSCLIRSESPDAVELDADWGSGVVRWSIRRDRTTGGWAARRHASDP